LVVTGYWSVMSGESTTPDLVERWRQTLEALERRDFDALMALYAPDAVWDPSTLGVGTFEGRVAIRRHFEDWIAPYEAYEFKLDEGTDLGSWVALAVSHQAARPAGGTRYVQDRPAAFVSEWVDGMVVRAAVYYDIDQARAAAERLAGERGG
jgi:ketosteroid isomerase-like protein